MPMNRVEFQRGLPMHEFIALSDLPPSGVPIAG